MIANENIQDQALENFKSEKTEVTIFFLKFMIVIFQFQTLFVPVSFEGKNV